MIFLKIFSFFKRKSSKKFFLNSKFFCIFLRRIFFADAGRNPKIEVANLDGSERKLVTNKNLLWPTDISIDEANERIYFADLKTKRIETLNFRLNDRRVVRGFSYDEGTEGPEVSAEEGGGNCDG